MSNTLNPVEPKWARSPVRTLRGFELMKHKLQSKLPLFTKDNNPSGPRYRSIRRHFIKRCDRVRLTEALTMDFIAKHTTIPVPRVLDVFELEGRTCIVQEYIDGHVLEDVWPELTEKQKREAILQLNSYLDQLRALEAPEPGKVQAVDGRGLVDDRMESGEWGPFATHEDFGNFSYRGYVRSNFDRYPGAAEVYAKLEGRKWRTVFAHGDFGPHNVIWKDGRIVAVIDWECAGWFPEYWEYTRTFLVTGRFPDHFPVRYSFWTMFNEVVDQYPDELAVERILMKNFDGFSI